MGISMLLHLFPAQVYWLINLSNDFKEKEIHGTWSKHLVQAGYMESPDTWQISGIEGAERNGSGWYKYSAVGNN